MMGRSPIRKILRNITNKQEFGRPNTDDVLYDPSFHHINSGGDCSECEASNRKKVVPRTARKKRSKEPVVHRGLILSGGGVVKNPEDRDRLRRGHSNAICFEMEAAGIMDVIPCLVIRGICDYADTHKHDGWHRYAAAVAAAYGKAILCKISGQDVEVTQSMREVMEKPS
ncbi:nucleoside phosphorylase domain-containing protein [Aspergillus navahoensis]